MINQYSSVQQIASALASGEVSSLDLVDFTISRISRLDSGINAVVVRDFDKARDAARNADKARGSGDGRPLLGLPITVKESFNVAGLATSWGIPAFRNWKPQAESQAIRNLKRAGVIIIGKTNISEGLSDWQCQNDIFGRTNNPWDHSRTPGGSSGGSAAALAAGFSSLELGSDLAGSIRIPAHFCGVFGHRPTQGLLSSEGYGFPRTFAPSDLTTIGPLARTASDLLLAFELLKHRADASHSVHIPQARHQKLAAFRVLLLENHPLVPSSARVRKPLAHLATELRSLGASVATSSRLLPDLAEATRNCLRLLVPITLSRVSDEHYQRIVERARQLQSDDISLAAIALRAGVGTHRDWLRASEVRCRLAMQWRRLFQDWDVVVCPVSSTVAFPHNHEAPEVRRLAIDDDQISYFDQIVWSTLATGCGLPATTVPCRHFGHALPASVQVIGAHGEDRTTLAFSAHLEEAFGGFVPPSAYIQ